MTKKLLLILSFLLIQVVSYHTVAAIGDWKAYMAYYDVQEIEEAGNLIFVRASNSLYVYNKNDQSIQTFSKADYLNDCDIQHIAYNKATKQLLILYSNANIDLMNVGNYDVYNLPDYYNAPITGDKTVNDICMSGKYAYLSNGFGIVKLNMDNREISDTYNLGFKVDWCEIKDNYIYAYSQQQGQYSAPLSTNLLDKKNWSKIGNYISKKEEDKGELQKLVSTLNPGGPKYNYFWFMKYAYNQLYTCGGGFGHLIELQRPGTVQIWNGDNWNVYDEDIESKTGIKYVDMNSLDIDPNDTSHVFVGAKSGLYEFQSGKYVQMYNSSNSPITSFNGTSKDYQIICTVKYDNNGNLWMLNSQSPQNESIIEYTKDKKWVSLKKDELYDTKIKASLAYMECLFLDSRNLLWFVNSYYSIPSLYCYQPSTNTLLSYKTFVNQDGTDIGGSSVQYVTEDKERNIWVSTAKNTFMINASDVGKENPTFTQIKIPRNDGTNYADYLLEGQNISSIVIDGGNRKWFGTKGNGVFLISADNMTEIYHFTSENSKLLSDNIESIAINEKNGEVFFGTDKGLCSYMSDASTTNESMNKDNVWAYPNPVSPDYTGLITITGLSFNSDVKIVTSNGMLVNQGRSNGGTYTWNGCDLKGHKVASGVYMVETATSNGEKGTVCKIAIIR